jgi:hypothetical protein
MSQETFRPRTVSRPEGCLERIVTYGCWAIVLDDLLEWLRLAGCSGRRNEVAAGQDCHLAKVRYICADDANSWLARL